MQSLSFREQMEFNVFEPVQDPYYQKMMDNRSPPIKGGYFWEKMTAHLQSQKRSK